MLKGSWLEITGRPRTCSARRQYRPEKLHTPTCLIIPRSSSASKPCIVVSSGTRKFGQWIWYRSMLSVPSLSRLPWAAAITESRCKFQLLTLVAMTARSRWLPSARPSCASEQYSSAVSKRLMPRSKAFATMASALRCSNLSFQAASPTPMAETLRLLMSTNFIRCPHLMLRARCFSRLACPLRFIPESGHRARGQHVHLGPISEVATTVLSPRRVGERKHRDYAARPHHLRERIERTFLLALREHPRPLLGRQVIEHPAYCLGVVVVHA